MCLVAALLTPAFVSSSQAVDSSSDGNDSVIYFIPFNIDTYVPITRETVVSGAWTKAVLSPSESVRLRSILSKGGRSSLRRVA